MLADPKVISLAPFTAAMALKSEHVGFATHIPQVWLWILQGYGVTGHGTRHNRQRYPLGAR